MTKLILTFRNFANAPKNCRQIKVKINETSLSYKNIKFRKHKLKRGDQIEVFVQRKYAVNQYVFKPSSENFEPSSIKPFPAL
jgi:hypothetical protein